MKKKKLKIRWDRVIMLLVVFISVVTILTLGVIKLVKDIKASDDVPYVYNINDSWETKKEMPTIKEFNKMIFGKNFTVKYLGEFKLTGYCNCEICCGQWSGGPCFNGEYPKENWTVAVDTDVIPLNSYIIFNDGVLRKAQDTGNAIVGNRIDVYLDSHDDCFDSWCNRTTGVYQIIFE